MNSMKLCVAATSDNVAFVRSTVAAFASKANPTVDELDDLKTAVSEAVTNVAVHAYGEEIGDAEISVAVDDCSVTVAVTDKGVGIEDLARAQESYFSTRAQDGRSGLGFTLMRAFTDGVNVQSEPGKGTVVILKKTFSAVKQ